MERRLEVLREPGVHELPLHFLSKAHDLPGHFAVLSVVVLGGNVGDHFDLNRSVHGRRRRHRPSPSKHSSPHADNPRKYKDLRRYYMFGMRNRKSSGGRPRCATPTGSISMTNRWNGSWSSAGSTEASCWV